MDDLKTDWHGRQYYIKNGMTIFVCKQGEYYRDKNRVRHYIKPDDIDIMPKTISQNKVYKNVSHEMINKNIIFLFIISIIILYFYLSI